MTDRSVIPDYSALEIPIDVWSEPFWTAGLEGRLIMPRCAECGTFRWPAGPFCSSCQSQAVEWVPPGEGRIYSFTILPVSIGEGTPPRRRIPTLVAFEQAPGIRLVAALVDARVEDVAIGALVDVRWQQAANTMVPVFKLSAG